MTGLLLRGSAVAPAAFALVGYFGFRHLKPVPVLVLAMPAWIAVACSLYLLLEPTSCGVFSLPARPSPRRRKR